LRTFWELDWELDGNKEELENPDINPYPNYQKNPKKKILGLLRACYITSLAEPTFYSHICLSPFST
jgi:hypothetical protein